VRDLRGFSEAANGHAPLNYFREALRSPGRDQRHGDWLKANRPNHSGRAGRRFNKTGTTYRLGSGVVRTHDASFCIGPVDAGLPRDDRVLTQKWLLETDEEKFLKIANRLYGLRW